MLRKQGKPVLLMLLLLLASLSAVSCSGAEGSQSLKLDFVPAAPALPSKAAFQEYDSYVVRCTGILETADGLAITATKSKSAKISDLVFIDLAKAQGAAADGVEIACVRVDGNEAAYSLSGARYRTVSLASAQGVVNSLGITYNDWATGLMGEGVKFPCCQ